MKYLPLLFILCLISCSNPPKKNESQEEVKNTIRKQEDYKKIDFHTHYRYDREFLVPLLKKWNMQAVIIDVPKEDLEQNELLEEFSEASFIAGVKSGIAKDESTMTVMDAQMNIQNFAMKRQQAMEAQSNEDAEKNLLEGMAFLEENKNRPEIQVTESGLQYEILKEGTGVSPLATDTVEVHYHGTLIDGTVFDSSVDRDETATFPVNGVIAGWTEALQLMKEGSKWKLYIPSELAYGSRQRSAEIKGNSTLIFEVELIDVKNK